MKNAQSSKNFFLIVFVFIVASSGCRKEVKESRERIVNSTEEFAKYLGVPSGIVKDSGSYYIVDGDMFFKKEDWLMTIRRQVTYDSTLYSPINYGEGLVSPENRGDVKIFISVETSLHSQSVIDRYKSAVRAAISNFNTLIPDASIKMREVFDSTLCDTKVRLTDEGDSDYGGFTIFPSFNGKSSEYVILNLYYEYNFNTVGKATQLATHELGHAIGLGHTNTPYEQQAGPVFYRHIPNTASLGTNPDPDSFILGGTYANNLSGWTQSLGNPTGVGFSDDDKIAISYLYPDTIPKMVIHYNNQSAVYWTITATNMTTNLVYTSSIGAHFSGIFYTLSLFPQGNYTFVISNNGDTVPYFTNFNVNGVTQSVTRSFDGSPRTVTFSNVPVAPSSPDPLIVISETP